MIQHLFSKEKRWKYGKINSVSSAEMLKKDLESKSEKFLTFIPLLQFLNSCSTIPNALPSV